MREKLVTAIYDLAGDEYVKAHDLFTLAIMSEEQLVDELINIAEYYRNNQ